MNYSNKHSEKSKHKKDTQKSNFNQVSQTTDPRLSVIQTLGNHRLTQLLATPNQQASETTSSFAESIQMMAERIESDDKSYFNKIINDLPINKRGQTFNEMVDEFLWSMEGADEFEREIVSVEKNYNKIETTINRYFKAKNNKQKKERKNRIMELYNLIVEPINRIQSSDWQGHPNRLKDQRSVSPEDEQDNTIVQSAKSRELAFDFAEYFLDLLTQRLSYHVKLKDNEAPFYSDKRLVANADEYADNPVYFDKKAIAIGVLVVKTTDDDELGFVSHAGSNMIPAISTAFNDAADNFDLMTINATPMQIQTVVNAQDVGFITYGVPKNENYSEHLRECAAVKLMASEDVKDTITYSSENTAKPQFLAMTEVKIPLTPDGNTPQPNLVGTVEEYDDFESCPNCTESLGKIIASFRESF